MMRTLSAQFFKICTCFLVVIITITAGVSISKRETVATCPNQAYPLFVGSWCKTLTSMTVLCSDNNNNANVRVNRLFEQQCNPNEHCVDFVLSNEVPFAMCVPVRKLLTWTNGQYNDKVCSG